MSEQDPQSESLLDTVISNIRRLVFKIQLSWNLVLDERVPLWMKLVPFATVAYILSPLDLVPDFILALGQIDDLVVLALGLELFEKLAPDVVVAEHRQRLENSA